MMAGRKRQGAGEKTLRVDQSTMHEGKVILTICDGTHGASMLVNWDEAMVLSDKLCDAANKAKPK